MKVKNQIPPSIITAAVGILNPFVPDITASKLIAALQDYASSKSTLDERPQKPYTVREVTKILMISKPTVYRMFEDGTLTRLKIRNSTRIPAKEINQLLTGG